MDKIKEVHIFVKNSKNATVIKGDVKHTDNGIIYEIDSHMLILIPWHQITEVQYFDLTDPDKE